MSTSYTGDHINLSRTDVQGAVVVKQINHHYPAHKINWPIRVGAIPEEAGHYQHRTVADQIESALDSFGTVVLRQVLSGTGGVGKTQLAAHHARSLRDVTDPRQKVDVLLWTDASNREQIAHAYTQAARQLFSTIPENPEDAAQLFLSWLHDPDRNQNRRWLIVWDDLTDPSQVKDLWPPHDRPHGRVLVTTRRRDHSLTTQGRRLLDVDVYSHDEALAFLTQALEATGAVHTTAQLNALAHDLGYLPLALGQAVTYMAELGMGCDDYLDVFHDRMSTLDQVFPDWEQPKPLAATWDLSLAQADTFHPLGTARPLMGLISLLDGTGIPEDVLSTPQVLNYLTTRHPHAKDAKAGPHPFSPSHQRSPSLLSRLRHWALALFPPAPSDETNTHGLTSHEVRASLTNLRRLNLITRTSPPAPAEGKLPVQALVSSHQLVQRATREHTASRPDRQSVRVLSDALMEVWPEVERDTVLAQRLRSNANALFSHDPVEGRASEEWLWEPDRHELLFRVGRSLGEAGRVAEAVAYWQRMTEAAAHHLGPDHPDTLIARGNLADSRGEAGDSAGATQAYARLVADCLQLLGTHHPASLIARHNLANWRGEAGDLTGAIQALQDILTDCLSVLGPDHPHTLTTRANLANWRGKAEDPVTAARALQNILADYLRVLGPDHPHTLSTRANLARLRGEAGDPAGAAQALHNLLTDYLRLLGPDHPHTLTARHGLAWWSYKVGDTAGAFELLAFVLDDRTRVLGPEHPHTNTSKRVLHSWYETLLTDHPDVSDGPGRTDDLYDLDVPTASRSNSRTAPGGIADSVTDAAAPGQKSQKRASRPDRLPEHDKDTS